jgi:hypothetical protein
MYRYIDISYIVSELRDCSNSKWIIKKVEIGLKKFLSNVQYHQKTIDYSTTDETENLHKQSDNSFLFINLLINIFKLMSYIGLLLVFFLKLFVF